MAALMAASMAGPLAALSEIELSKTGTIVRALDDTETQHAATASARTKNSIADLNAKFTLRLREFAQRKFKVGPRMGRRNLHPDARLALRHHRIRKGDHIHPLIQHRFGDPNRQRRVPEHDGNDGMFARQNVPAHLRHSLPEKFRVLLELVPQVR